MGYFDDGGELVWGTNREEMKQKTEYRGKKINETKI